MSSGNSVGEFAALAAANAMSVEEALTLVRERGIAMAEAAAAHPGSMAAILGLEDEVRRDALPPDPRRLAGELQLPGADRRVRREQRSRRVHRGARRRKAARRTVKLKVSGAFHSPLVARAADRLRPAIDKVKFQEPTAPFMSTVTARLESAQRMAPLLVDQLTAPVRFTQAASELMKDGVKTFVEVGPGNVLSGLVRRIDRSVKAISVNNLAALDKLPEALAET